MSAVLEVTSEDRTAILFGNVPFEIPEPLRMARPKQEEVDDPENECMFHIVAPRHGDKRVVWNRNSIAEIRAAEETFKKLLAQGMVAFYVDNKGKKQDGKLGQPLRPMTKFDPHAGKVIFAPMGHPITGKPVAVGG